MDQATVDFYARNATDIAQRYEQVSSPLQAQFPLAFAQGARVLDIGCGSGRDAAILQSMGCDVYGVEPTQALREAAVAAHPSLSGRISDAGLPNLGVPFGGEFDGVLCCAVLMHLPQHQLFDAAFAIRQVLKSNGRLLISLPLSRGEALQDDRDTHGRLFKSYAPDEIALLFERLGFQEVGRWQNADAMARAGTTWYTVLLELRSKTIQRPLDQIEAILNRDKKEATYKLALFRALAEIATQEARRAIWMPGGEVGVPLERIAQLWMQYYWPIVANNRFVPQSQAEGADGKSLKFRSALAQLAGAFTQQGDHAGLTSWYLAQTSGTLPVDIQTASKQTLRVIAQTIKDGPVTFSGGALESGPVFRYDAQSRCVVMAADLWRELCLMGHWVSDAVIVRWAALTQRFGVRQGVTAADVLPLLLAKPEPQRATALARRAFEAARVDQCIWTGKPLRQQFAVDHVIPFSLWGNNDLWNLVPADPKANLSKSDKLPSAELLIHAKDRLVCSWAVLRNAMPQAFAEQALHVVGRQLPTSSGWESELHAALREAVELTAIQRGCERWNGVGARS